MRSELLPVVGRYAARSDRFETVIADVPDSAWSAPSPCPQWTAIDLVQHVLETHAAALRALRSPLTDAPSVHDAPLVAFRSARCDLATALLRYGRRDGLIDGPAPQAGALHDVDRVVGGVLVLHAWDLARAMGRPHRIDAEEVDRLWHRTPREACGPAVEVRDTAPLQDRLLGLLGRDPRWTAPVSLS